MKKRGKMLILAAAVLAAAGLWTWRFITLNSCYHGLVGEMGEDRVYAVGDTVPLDYAEGYSLRADGFEIVGFEDIDPDLFAETYAARSGAEGRLGLLRVTLFNIGSEKDKFSLPDLRLRGEDTVFNVDEGLLKGLNPSLEGRADAVLQKGESCSLVLPYILYKAQFPFGWAHLDRCALYLNVTINADIRLQRAGPFEHITAPGYFCMTRQEALIKTSEKFDLPLKFQCESVILLFASSLCARSLSWIGCQTSDVSGNGVSDFGQTRCGARDRGSAESEKSAVDYCLTTDF